VLHKLNPSLIFARLSGFGQSGPMSSLPGHDINYISQSGVLSALVDSSGKPQPPVNLVADFAGGGLLLTNGILAALLERSSSGLGQVLDLSMAEGSAYASSFLWQMGQLFAGDVRGKNLLDGGAHFYDTYKTKDERWMAVGAIEPQFYSVLIEKLELDVDLSEQMDSSLWPEMKQIFSSKFATKTMTEWTQIFDGSEACCSPILTFEEAAEEKHNIERDAFFDSEGILVPASAPIFSRSGNPKYRERPQVGEHTRQILTEFDFDDAEIESLLDNGAVAAV